MQKPHVQTLNLISCLGPHFLLLSNLFFDITSYLMLLKHVLFVCLFVCMLYHAIRSKKISGIYLFKIYVSENVS